jgi:DNA-binding MarR family transcriptional regulator
MQPVIIAARLAEADLVPAHVGIFRILSTMPAISQQALATALGTVPIRLVALVDDLESRGLVERRALVGGRRTYALHLTDKGKATMETIGRIAREHRQDLVAALSDEEQATLSELLQRFAEQQGLPKGVHPGMPELAVPKGFRALNKNASDE